MELKERLYGKIAQGGCTIIETPELLKPKSTVSSLLQPPIVSENLGEKNQQSVPKVTKNCVEVSSFDSTLQSSSVKAPINKQIETKTTDGKRRITPMFIPPPPEVM